MEKPFHVLVVWLPPGSPELNPIKLVFHILAQRIRSYRTKRNIGPCDNKVVKHATQVMNEISFETIAKCYLHCGY
jgi:hypothetical protein